MFFAGVLLPNPGQGFWDSDKRSFLFANDRRM